MAKNKAITPLSGRCKSTMTMTLLALYCFASFYRKASLKLIYISGETKGIRKTALNSRVGSFENGICEIANCKIEFVGRFMSKNRVSVYVQFYTIRWKRNETVEWWVIIISTSAQSIWWVFKASFRKTYFHARAF